MKWLRYLIIALLAAFAATLVYLKQQDDLERALKTYRAGAHLDSFNTASQLNQRMDQLYQQLRTIARLPGIRSLDERAGKLNAETQQTLQELYNTLAINSGVSEIHIIPADFEPGNTATPGHHRPLQTFDQLVGDRAANDSRLTDTGSVQRSPVMDAPEYDLMQEQLRLIKAQYPAETHDAAYEVPAYLGPEIITRDNSHYSANDPDDRNRSGLVYSVPFYNKSGTLAGMISGVILSNTLRDLVKDGYYAIHSATHEYVAGRQQGSVWLRVLPFIEADAPDPSLLYSEVQALEFRDAQGGWTLWSWQPDIFYVQREDVRAANNSAMLAYGSILLLTVAGYVLLYVLQKRREMLLTMNQQLADQVRIRTADLEHAVTVAEHATRAKSQFLANMSHEIRTPMNGVVGMLDIISNTGMDLKIRGYVDIARQSANSLLRIIDDILDYSKIEAGKIVVENIEYDVQQLVEDVASLLANKCHSKGLVLNCDTPTEMTHLVFGDPTRVRQVLLNLVGNAIKFTEKGQVGLQLSCQPTGDDRLNIRFVVSDTGIGITDEAKEKLFTPFNQADGSTTRRFGGTGLGLTISQRLVELMSGKITAFSVKDQGSKFEFTLPVSIGSAMPAMMETQAELRGKRVLIVDDNVIDCEILQHHLDHWKMQHHTTHNAAAALKALQAGLDGHPFDIALLDMVLPDQDGLALSKIIEADEKLRDTKRLLLTAVTSVTQEQLRKHYISNMHIKPVRPRELHKSFLTLIGGDIGHVISTSEFVNDDSLPAVFEALVVDDNEINQTVVALMLEKFGGKIICKANGEEALEALNNHNFDLVLLDCHMPIMDGFETIKQLRDKEMISHQHQLVIALTASAMQEDRDRCLAAGMDDFLTKPVTLKELQRVLTRWLPGKFLAVA